MIQIKQKQNHNHIVLNSLLRTETCRDRITEETEIIEELTKEEEDIKTEVLEEIEEEEVNNIHHITTGTIINTNYNPQIQQNKLNQNTPHYTLQILRQH